MSNFQTQRLRMAGVAALAGSTLRSPVRCPIATTDAATCVHYQHCTTDGNFTVNTGNWLRRMDPYKQWHQMFFQQAFGCHLLLQRRPDGDNFWYGHQRAWEFYGVTGSTTLSNFTFAVLIASTSPGSIAAKEGARYATAGTTILKLL